MAAESWRQQHLNLGSRVEPNLDRSQEPPLPLLLYQSLHQGRGGEAQQCLQRAGGPRLGGPPHLGPGAGGEGRPHLDRGLGSVPTHGGTQLLQEHPHGGSHAGSRHQLGQSTDFTLNYYIHYPHCLTV